MIYMLLALEFFKIGLLAVGGGLVTIPFLFDLANRYAWFSVSELTDMIAVSESTPGPMGINMATYAGFETAGVVGALVATLCLVTPSVIVIILLSRFLKKFSCDIRVQDVLTAIRPAVLALILAAGWKVAQLAVRDWFEFLIFAIFLAAIRIFKRSPILYILLAAVLGIVCKI